MGPSLEEQVQALLRVVDRLDAKVEDLTSELEYIRSDTRYNTSEIIDIKRDIQKLDNATGAGLRDDF